MQGDPIQGQEAVVLVVTPGSQMARDLDELLGLWSREPERFCAATPAMRQPVAHAALVRGLRECLESARHRAAA